MTSVNILNRYKNNGDIDTVECNWYLPYNIQIINKEWQYRGEGNANLILALPQEKKIIRLRKSTADTTEYDVNTECKRMHRELLFCQKVIIPLIGNCYLKPPRMAVVDDTQIKILNSILINQRPAFRAHKCLMIGHATIYPDYTLLPLHLDSSRSFPIFCVEIKPKQGWVAIPDRHTFKCTFCIHQYLKIKNGSVKHQSMFCPLDLFSGNYDRMKKALKALLFTPQNNLKIFRNGTLVYDEHHSDKLEIILNEWFADYNRTLEITSLIETWCGLMLQALNRDLSTCQKVNKVHLAEKVDEAHTTEQCNFVSAPSVEYIPNPLVNIINDITTDSRCDWTAETLPENSILNKILAMQKLDQYGTYSAYKEYKLLSDSKLTDEYAYVDELTKPGVFLTTLHCYLLAATAKDCSIMLSFQKVSETQNMSHDVYPEEHILHDANGKKFVCNIGILDIDPKPMSSVLKHFRRDHDALSACFDILKIPH